MHQLSIRLVANYITYPPGKIYYGPGVETSWWRPGRLTIKITSDYGREVNLTTRSAREIRSDRQQCDIQNFEEVYRVRILFTFVNPGRLLPQNGTSFS